MRIQYPYLISVCPYSCLFCAFLPLDPCVDAGCFCWWISGCRILLLHQFLKETHFKLAGLLALLSSLPPLFPGFTHTHSSFCLFPSPLPFSFAGEPGGFGGSLGIITPGEQPSTMQPPGPPLLLCLLSLLLEHLGLSSPCLALGSPFERNSVFSTWF